jgi:hypothetical protein
MLQIEALEAGYGSIYGIHAQCLIREQEELKTEPI